MARTKENVRCTSTMKETERKGEPRWKDSCNGDMESVRLKVDKGEERTHPATPDDMMGESREEQVCRDVELRWECDGMGWSKQ